MKRYMVVSVDIDGEDNNRAMAEVMTDISAVVRREVMEAPYSDQVRVRTFINVDLPNDRLNTSENTTIYFA